MLLQLAGVDPFLAAPLFKVTGHGAIGTAAGMTKRVEERQLLRAPPLSVFAKDRSIFAALLM